MVAGILLCGDTFLVTPDQDWVTFMRSFPNLIPLSAAVVEGVAERVLSLDFDRLYDNSAAGSGRVRPDGFGDPRSATSGGSAATTTI